ncbi:MAG: tape measure protein [Bacteroidota bacterium]
MASQLLIRVGIRLDSFEKGVKIVERKMSRLSSRLSRLGSELSTNISLPVAGVATAAVSAFAKLERLENGLKAIADEGEDTAKTLERLQRIAQLPGISLEQAIQGSNQLRNVGFEARQAEIILRELSKAVTLSGAGPEQLQSVVRQLVQMSSKGRILQEDLGVILENVPSVGIAIQDAFGTQSIDAIRATGVSAQEFTAKIIQAISANEKFQNVQGGLANDFDNFRQSVTRSLAELGRSIAESINLSAVLQRLSSFIAKVTERFKNLSPSTQRFIVIAAGVAAAMGPVILGLGATVKTIALVVGSIKLVSGALLTLVANPIGATLAAIAALVIAFKRAYDSSSTFRANVQGIIAVIKEFARKAVEFLTLPISLFQDLLSGNFEAAGERIKSVFGAEPGQKAGQAFANAFNQAYNKSIGQSSARNFGTRGRLGGSRQAEPTNINTDLANVFAGLPSGGASGISSSPTTAITEPFSVFRDQADGIISDVSRISAQAQRAGTSLREMAASSGLQAELGKNIGELGLKVQTTGTNFKSVNDGILSEYNDKIASINQRMLVFGDSFDGVSAKVSTTRAAIEQALENGFDPMSETVLTLKESLIGLQEAADGLDFGETLAGGITAFGEALSQTLSDGALSFKTFANAALSAISAVIGALIKEGVTAAVASALKTSTFLTPIGQIAVASAAGTAASALFRGLLSSIQAPKLAKGGIIPPGFSGDRFPALLNSGEAVLPIDRLMQAIGEGGGTGEFVLRGDVLVAALKRANYNNARIAGG